MRSALLFQLPPQPIGGGVGGLIAPALQLSGLLLQHLNAVGGIELICQCGLAAMLQPVHRFMQQGAGERRIAVVVVAAEANAVARWRIETLQA